MPKYTDNYNLILPNIEENYDVGTANTNNSIIDNALDNKVNKIVGKDLSTNDFTDAYKKKIDSMQRLYKYKGSLDTYSQLLEKIDNTIGDVWNILEDNNNYCWDGLDWVELGINIDLSEYATNESVDAKINETKEQLSERNVLTIALSEHYTLTTKDVTKLPLNKILLSKGDKITLGEDGGIIIGNNVNELRISGNVYFRNGQSSEDVIVAMINRNNTTAVNITTKASTASDGVPIPTKNISVATGDVIYLIAQNQAREGQQIGAFDGLTFLNVEVI